MGSIIKDTPKGTPFRETCHSTYSSLILVHPFLQQLIPFYTTPRISQPRHPFTCGDVDSIYTLIHATLLLYPSPQPKRHLDRFSRFLQGSRPTDHATPSVTWHLHSIAMRPNNIMHNKTYVYGSFPLGDRITPYIKFEIHIRNGPAYRLPSYSYDRIRH